MRKKILYFGELKLWNVCKKMRKHQKNKTYFQLMAYVKLFNFNFDKMKNRKVHWAFTKILRKSKWI